MDDIKKTRHISDIAITAPVHIPDSTVKKVDPVIVQPTRTKIVRSTARERFLVLLVMILNFGGVIAISKFVLIHMSLRLDESQSIWQSSHSFRGMLHAVALDVHVPLYHTILHYWMFFFGNAIPTIRILSLIFFLASIPVAYLVARFILSLRWALLASVLYSFSPFMNWYANEARMYTLLVLMSLLSMYFFMKIMRTGRGWFWFTITALLGAYSHYFFFFVLATEGIYFLLARKQFAKGTFLKLTGVALAVTVAIGPWLYYFHKLGSASGTRPHLVRPSTVDFANAYSQFLFGFMDNHINTIILSSWPLLMLLVLVAVRRGIKVGYDIGFIAAMALVPVALAYGLSLIVTPFFLSRYLIASVLPILVLLLWLFSKYGRKFAVGLAILALVVSGLGSYEQAVSAQTPVKEDYRAVATDINNEIKPQDLVVLSAPFTIYPFEYYYRGSAQIDTLPDWNRAAVGAIPAFNAKTMPAQIMAQNQHHRYIYLVLSQDQGYESTISHYYLTHFKQISHKVYSPDLTLYVYQVGYYTVPPLADETYTVPQ
jgi:mannosyltransferase